MNQVKEINKGLVVDGHVEFNNVKVNIYLIFQKQATIRVNLHSVKVSVL